MKLNLHNHYPYPAETVVRVFGDQDFFTEKYRRVGASNIRVLDFSNEHGESHIRVRRDVDLLGALPPFARSILPGTLTVIQTDYWNQHTLRGGIDLELVAVPVRITCDMTLENDGQGTVQTLDFDITVDLPLISERIARLLASDLEKQVRTDSEAAAEIMPKLAPRYQPVAGTDG